MTDMCLTVLCSECNGAFNECANACGTSCGHLLHYSCLTQFRTRGSSCKKCAARPLYPYKLYFSFEGPDDYAEQQAAAELKLKNSNKKITQLQVELSESQTNFLQLQKQFSEIEQAKLELKGRMKEVEESEGNFLTLQGQLTESWEREKQLKGRMNQLKIEIEGTKKQLALKRLENETLRADLDTEPTTMTDNMLSERIKYVERKLKLVTDQFEKEIYTNTQLTIDKMKLTTYLNHLTALRQNAQPVEVINAPRNTRRRQPAEPKPKQGAEPKPKQAAESKPSDTRNGVLVRDLQLEQIAMPLENTIINLASKMQLNISSDDLIKVSFIENKEASSPPMLLAQFKRHELKDQFIAKKHILKLDSTTKSITISQYVSEELLPLYRYAKEKLLINGFFKSVYCKNDRIFARKNRRDRNAVHINSKVQVDNMIKRLMEDVATKNLDMD